MLWAKAIFAFFDEHSTGTSLTVQCDQISTAHLMVLFLIVQSCVHTRIKTANDPRKR